jgi:hypothetical protein
MDDPIKDAFPMKIEGADVECRHIGCSSPAAYRIYASDTVTFDHVDTCKNHFQMYYYPGCTVYEYAREGAE